jgi:hypothetical protein
MNADDLADIRADLDSTVRAASERLYYAELAADRRTWTPSELDAYLAAQSAFEEAYDKLAAFDAAHPELNHAKA